MQVCFVLNKADSCLCGFALASCRLIRGVAGLQNQKRAGITSSCASGLTGQQIRIPDHFVDITEMVGIGSGAQRKIEDWALSRYACYLVIQNADPSKPLVALGQTYFAVQTRRQELAEDETLKENQKRLLLRQEMTKHNKQLAGVAKQAGVIQPGQFGR